MQKQPLSTQIAEKLESMIFEDSAYLPGQQLPTERELAESLGASRTSIREAIKQLSAKGILHIRHGVGTFVADTPGVSRDPLGVEEEPDIIAVLEDWYRVRMILESGAMELVVANASREELQHIREIMDEELRLGETDGAADFLSEDQNFHCALARATHNRIMERLIPSLHASVYYDMVKSLYDQLHTRYNRNARSNHALILSCLEQRDPQGASTAMRFHMLQGILDVRSLREAP